MADQYPTINLSQAVMLYVYVLSKFTLKTRLHVSLKENLKYQNSAPPDRVQYLALKNLVKEVLLEIGLGPDNRSHHRILDRLASMNMENLRLIFDVCNKFKYIKRQD